MNEEEKQALEIIKGLGFEDYDWWVQSDYVKGHADEVVSIVENALNTIIELIEKQQKEIEELKSRKYILNAKTQEIKEIPISDDYVSKDKIIEKIKKLETSDILADYIGIQYLRELLGE